MLQNGIKTKDIQIEHVQIYRFFAVVPPLGNGTAAATRMTNMAFIYTLQEIPISSFAFLGIYSLPFRPCLGT